MLPNILQNTADRTYFHKTQNAVELLSRGCLKIVKGHKQIGASFGNVKHSKGYFARRNII